MPVVAIPDSNSRLASPIPVCVTVLVSVCGVLVCVCVSLCVGVGVGVGVVVGGGVSVVRPSRHVMSAVALYTVWLVQRPRWPPSAHALMRK